MDDLEDLLRRYRPAGPPRHFRGDLLNTAAGVSRRRTAVEWLPPLGAAAAAAVFYVLTNSIERDLSESLMRSPDQYSEVIAAISEDLGGDDLARWQAERMMARSEDADRVAAPLQIFSPYELGEQ
jgi:hypothetical protein